MDAEKTQWPVKAMCRVLRVSRAGYYAWRKREESQRAAEDRRLGEIIRKSHEQSRKPTVVQEFMRIFAATVSALAASG